jgi:prepilin-type N-terminal cleavage/methylation domain
MTTRRGFTLVELLVGLVLLLAVGAVTYQLLVNSQRVTRSQSQHVGMQDNVRSGTLIIGNELREVGYDQVSAAAILKFPLSTLVPGANPDLIAIGPDSITYRAMRGIGYTCQLNSATPEIVVHNSVTLPFSTLRALTTTDSLMLYVENDPSISGDDMWLTVGITQAPSALNCPDGTAGMRIKIGFPAALNITAVTAFNNMVVGGPVRAFELMQIRSYVSGGQLWLGMRSRPLTAGTTIEPLLGPLSNGNGATAGLTFTFNDAANAVTTVPNNVRSIQASLNSISNEVVRTTGMYAKVDSLTLSTRVALRNALRP